MNAQSLMIVDDERDVVDMFRQAFRRETRNGQYELTFAHSGQEAIEKICASADKQPFCVLSDINMPGMDGLELLARIKEKFPSLPVIMVTAYGDSERQLTAQKYGATGFMLKPVDFMALKDQLKALVEQVAVE